MTARRHRRRTLPKEPVSLRIESMSHEGRGLGHLEGKVVVVDGALAGERVQARYVRRRGKFDELTTIAVEEAAADRVATGCEYAGTCGGCSLRHMDPRAQLAFKESLLLEQLQRCAGVEPTEFAKLPKIAGDSAHYRGKARLAVRLVTRKGGVLVGFREKYSTFVTDMSDCQVLSREVAQLIPGLRELLTGLQCAADIPQIEVAVGESSADSRHCGQVALVFRHLKPLTGSDQQALLDFAASHGIHLYLQPGGADSVHKLYPDGPPRFDYYLPEFDLHLKFHPQDFTQVNSSINRQIVGRTIELLELKKSDKVLDLFCGIGNFTLPLALHSSAVIGVEGSSEMVQRGKENALLNNILNVDFVEADLSRADNAQWSEKHYHKIVLDPPRSGALEIMSKIVNCKAEKIIYISCNPVTLARDAGFLVSNGYRLKSAGVMDMFPHTTHVESMVVFERC